MRIKAVAVKRKPDSDTLATPSPALKKGRSTRTAAPAAGLEEENQTLSTALACVKAATPSEEAEERDHVVGLKRLAQLAKIWLPEKITVCCGSKAAELVGGHTSSPEHVYVLCTCVKCMKTDDNVWNLQSWAPHSGAGKLASRSAKAVYGQYGAVAGKLHHIAQMTPLYQFLLTSSRTYGGKKLIGAKVWVHWYDQPTGKKGEVGVWYEACVVDYVEGTGEYKIHYSIDDTDAKLFLNLSLVHFGSEAPKPGAKPVAIPPAATAA